MSIDASEVTITTRISEKPDALEAPINIAGDAFTYSAEDVVEALVDEDVTAGDYDAGSIAQETWHEAYRVRANEQITRRTHARAHGSACTCDAFNPQEER